MDKQIRVRSIQCAPNSSQANARAFSIHPIVARAARDHDAYTFCFITPPYDPFLLGISVFETCEYSDDPFCVNCNALLSRFANGFRGQQIASSKHSVCTK